MGQASLQEEISSKQINILKRISKYLNVTGRINVYRSFISSNFSYCPVVWMFCGKKNSNKLEKLQERALRFVFDDSTSSYIDLLKKGNFLSLSSYRMYFLGIEVFKSKHQKSPEHIQKLFQSKHLTHNLRDCSKFIQTDFNTKTYGFKSFSYYGAKLWNSLPICVKKSKNVDIFKEWCHSDDCKKLEICWYWKRYNYYLLVEILDIFIRRIYLCVFPCHVFNLVLVTFLSFVCEQGCYPVCIRLHLPSHF